MTDAEEAVQVLSSAFNAPAQLGVPALEGLANQLAAFDSAPLHNLACIEAHATNTKVEARELMTALMSTTPSFASPAQAALYVVILSRLYPALLMETVARRRRLEVERLNRACADSATDGDDASADDARVLAAASATMRAWSRDLLPLIVHSVLPQLCLRDAQPHTFSTTQRLTAESGVPFSPFVEESDDGWCPSVKCSQRAEGGAEEEQQQQQLYLLRKALCDYGVPAALVRLVEAVFRGTRDDTACPLLLAVYAAVFQMEEDPASPRSPDETDGGTVAASVLRKWRHRFLQEVDSEGKTDAGGGRDDAPGTPLVPSPAASKRGAVQTALGIDAAATKLRSLLDEVVRTVSMPDAGDTWSFALTHVSIDGFPRANESALFSADIERGAAPPETTAALLAKEREDAADACTLVEVDCIDALSHSSDSDTADPASTSLFSAALCRQGALFLLADVLRETERCDSALYSVTSTALLLSVASAYATALTCASQAALRRHLLLLHEIVVTIPKYSVDCAAEEQTLPGSSAPSLSEESDFTLFRSRSFDSCLTKRYEALFAMEKELLSVSALCPSHEHRRAARVIALELLERLKEEPRVRMHLSLLTLCPYPSITRFFLERLLQDWREQQQLQQQQQKKQGCGDGIRSSTASRVDTATGGVTIVSPKASLPPSPLACMVPMGLGGCMLTFLQHLTSGTRGFLDPLIVSLNFVRVSASRHNWIRAAGQKVQNHPRPQHHDSSVQQAWGGLFEVLKQEVFPKCEALLNPLEVSTSSPFALPALSPLDAFSLSCAVDGVKAILQ